MLRELPFLRLRLANFEDVTRIGTNRFPVPIADGNTHWPDMVALSPRLLLDTSVLPLDKLVVPTSLNR